MEDYQYDCILEQLIMIESNTRKKEEEREDNLSLLSTVCETPTNPIYKFRRIFFARLEAKTGWGRIELKKLFEESMTEALEKEKILTDECPF